MSDQNEVVGDLIDLYTPAAPGSLMRAIVLETPGRYRLARRDCELYSVQIPSCGDFGQVRVLNGKGRPIFRQPSTFTGSFWLSAGCEDGLIAELFALNTLTLTVNWRERDRQIV